MGILTWLQTVIGGKTASKELSSAEFLADAAEFSVRKLALESACNLVSGVLGKCEFRTLERGHPVKQSEYYRWNVQPNVNQSKSVFLDQLIHRLFYHNAALVVQSDDGQLLLADHWTEETFAMRESVFSGVTVGDFTFQRRFSSSEVLYFRLNAEDAGKVIKSVYASYGKMIAAAEKAYQRNRGRRALVTVSAAAQNNPNFAETMTRLTGSDMEKFLKSDYGTLPVYEGFAYDEPGSKTYASESSRDIRAMVDDIFDFSARAFCIPPALLRGELADTTQAVQNLLTFCVDPLAAMLAAEINAKAYDLADILADTRMEIRTQDVCHIDVMNAGNAVDKLISSGTFCINEIRQLLHEPIIDEPWAWEHFITKNYGEVKGGEKSGEK